MRLLAALRNVRISRLQVKLLAIVGTALAFAVIVALAALTRVYGAAKDVERIGREDFETQLAIVRTEAALQTQLVQWQRVLLRAGDAGGRESQWDAFQQAGSAVRSFASDSRDGTSDPELKGALEAFLAANDSARASYDKAYEALKHGTSPADLERQGAEAARASARLDEAEAVAQEHGSRLINAAIASGRRAYEVAMVATIAAMALALVGVALYTRRALLAPIAAAASYAERIARGDLTGRSEATSRDEAGQLLASIGHMNDGLSRVVAQVRSAAEAVAQASGEVAAGMTDLSQHTEEQASSLEETAASMEELSGAVRSNADAAREADELARSAYQRAEQGGSEVVNVVVTMEGIRTSAQRIAEITGAIDNIAFQTNILALNAAVEAARAGEQGRGFAVVAAEVRSLAQRSAQSAREIKDLIAQSLSKVEGGAQAVEQAGDTITGLVIDVKRVSDLMRSIADACAEQSRGVEQVNKTVAEMDKVVQQNASAVQRSASAAEAMREEADTLLQAVGTFRVAQGAPAQAAARVAPAPAPRSVRAMHGDVRRTAAAVSEGWKEL